MASYRSPGAGIGQVLFGFAYLNEPEEYERRVNLSTELTDIDTEFQENNQGLLERFYQLFESILKYLVMLMASSPRDDPERGAISDPRPVTDAPQVDLKQFISDVEQGFYIQHTVGPA
jgi:hypothetical protein